MVAKYTELNVKRIIYWELFYMIKKKFRARSHCAAKRSCSVGIFTGGQSLKYKLSLFDTLIFLTGKIITFGC